jgi:hypothetical protein
LIRFNVARSVACQDVPMPGTLAGWHLTKGGWLQMHHETIDASKSVHLDSTTDPDGNTITLIGQSRTTC